MTFRELRLAEPIVRAVTEEGYSNPTPIQAAAIPVAIEGRDVLACAQTGTGKTAAFALPILHRLAATPRTRPTHAKPARPRALVVCPTRELAAQIHEAFRAYARHAKVRSCVIFGGVGQSPQEARLAAAPDILIATPGRLLDLINQGIVALDAIEVLVLDEADRMLDMGFIHDIRRIVKGTPAQRQTMLFSATMPAEIDRLSHSILRNPARVQVDRVASTGRSVSQLVYRVDKSDKPRLLDELLRRPEVARTLVFTRTKHGADRVVKGLLRAGIGAVAIHGDKSQTARTRALDSFRSARLSVLVATDIAARGIDVDGVTHVFNFDVPADPETYVHRIGRTARAGASGVAVSFCSPEEANNLRAIERLIGSPISVADAASTTVPHEKSIRARANGSAPPRNPSPAPRERRDGATGPKPRRIHRSEIGLSARESPSNRRGPRSPRSKQGRA